MVSEVTAFAAADGSLYADKQDALKRDAYLQLEKLSIFNHASMLQVIEHRNAIFDALAPLCIGVNTKTEEPR